MNISSNTLNGYTSENHEERLFFNETAFDSHFAFGVMHCKNLEVQIAVFSNETCYGDGNWYKDLLFVYLQPSVNKNS